MAGTHPFFRYFKYSYYHLATMQEISHTLNTAERKEWNLVPLWHDGHKCSQINPETSQPLRFLFCGIIHGTFFVGFSLTWSQGHFNMWWITFVGFLKLSLSCVPEHILPDAVVFYLFYITQHSGWSNLI